MGKVRATLFRSVIATPRKHRAIIQSLGLRHRQHSVTLLDTPEVRGMLRCVSHLVKYEAIHVPE